MPLSIVQLRRGLGIKCRSDVHLELQLYWDPFEGVVQVGEHPAYIILSKGTPLAAPEHALNTIKGALRLFPDKFLPCPTQTHGQGVQVTFGSNSFHNYFPGVSLLKVFCKQKRQICTELHSPPGLRRPALPAPPPAGPPPGRRVGAARGWPRLCAQARAHTPQPPPPQCHASLHNHTIKRHTHVRGGCGNKRVKLSRVRSIQVFHGETQSITG